MKKFLKHIILLTPMLLLLCLQGMAQKPVKVFSIKNGRQYIMLSRNLPADELESFISDFNLADLDLKTFVRTALPDSLQKLGWKLEMKSDELVAISKKLEGFDAFDVPGKEIGIAADVLPAQPKSAFGYNRFKNKNAFAVNENTVTFFLRGHANTRQVLLAGSFTSWQHNAIAMTQTDSGWIATVELKPGKHLYKFIADGQWVTDRDNRNEENDGRGNNNSVYYKPNYVFRSHAFAGASKVFLAGSFNFWNPDELRMIKTGDGWELPVYLAEGTHTYRYVADGKWTADPENNEKFPNEFNGYNSVIRLGRPQLFTLDGFTDANKVSLAGSFNAWKDNELLMNKTEKGWELNYVLGPGNYEYAFRVDDKWISRDNTEMLTNKADRAKYLNLVKEPNYTFCLNGFADAAHVFIAGDFNNWSPTTYEMTKTDSGWKIDLHLEKGKHHYKFVVDGKWTLDPGNPLWEQNEYNTGNSVLWIE